MNKQSYPDDHELSPWDRRSIPPNDNTSDDVVFPDGIDPSEYPEPKPKPDLPWWAPLLPYLPFAAPLWMESNTDIDDLDLNFLLEVQDRRDL
jgi:hypothetical protein